MKHYVTNEKPVFVMDLQINLAQYNTEVVALSFILLQKNQFSVLFWLMFNLSQWVIWREKKISEHGLQ